MKNPIDRLAGIDAPTPRIPWWVWWPGAWLITGALIQVPLWLSVFTEFPEVHREAVVAPFYFVASIAAYVYLTRAGAAAFDRFRPALSDDGGSAEARRRLTSLPASWFWVPLLVGGTVFATITYFDDSAAAEIMRLGAGGALYTILTLVSFGVHFSLGTLIIRQLRTVSRLHERATHIDLFRPDPLHAFASLTSRAGVVVIGLMLYSALTDPATFENKAYFAITIVAVVLGVATFVLPLLGMRKRLAREKHRLSDEVAGRLSDVTADLHDAVDQRRLDEVGGLKTTLEVLTSEQQRIRRTSTWPWDAGTARGFATTILLPILTWLVTAVLSETLGL